MTLPGSFMDLGSISGGKGNGPRLFCGHVPKEVDEMAVKAHFSQWGPVTDVYFPRHKKTLKRRPFCFVTFATIEGLRAALTGSPLNICGHPIKSLTAVEDRNAYYREKHASAPCCQLERGGGAPPMSRQPHYGVSDRLFGSAHAPAPAGNLLEIQQLAQLLAMTSTMGAVPPTPVRPGHGPMTGHGAAQGPVAGPFYAPGAALQQQHQYPVGQETVHPAAEYLNGLRRVQELYLPTTQAQRNTQAALEALLRAPGPGGQQGPPHVGAAGRAATPPSLGPEALLDTECGRGLGSSRGLDIPESLSLPGTARRFPPESWSVQSNSPDVGPGVPASRGAAPADAALASLQRGSWPRCPPSVL
uniref:RRM domain-containing protein n=1 Tax=Auxenochlorella protothecoides TaxID=3075 RepID=A0A1D2A792_AUXPR